MIRGSFHMSGLFALRIYSERVSDVKERDGDYFLVLGNGFISIALMPFSVCDKRIFLPSLSALLIAP